MQAYFGGPQIFGVEPRRHTAVGSRPCAEYGSDHGHSALRKTAV